MEKDGNRGINNGSREQKKIMNFGGNISRYRRIFQIYFEIVIEEEGEKLDKKRRSRDVDDNNEERKNTAFWKIFEIAIEEEKTKKQRYR